MARYKPYSYEQGKLIPIHFQDQILPGSFEYTLNYLIDNEVDLSVFEDRYKNDETGAPAYDPAILLKIVLFAYSLGIVSSRKIARCCNENVVFMALSADSGFHTEANMKMLYEEQIDGYVADNLFRKRDPRFATAERYKKARREFKEKRFTHADFVFDRDRMSCTCPGGKKLYLKNRNFQVGGYRATSFQGAKRDCVPCGLREQCLKRADQQTTRQVHFFEGRSPGAPETFTQKMKRKIDTWEGRLLYGRRLGIAEPVFGNVCRTKGLDRFTLRGKAKVTTQWRLYNLVHNIGKIQRYGAVFA